MGSKARLSPDPLKPAEAGKGRRLVSNTAINILQSPTALLIQLFLTPFILGNLGRSAYGIWALTASVLSYLPQLQAGLNSAVNYQVPQRHQKGDLAGINRVVSTVFAFYSLMAVVGCGFTALVVWKFPVWFSVPSDLITASRIVSALVGGAALVTLVTSVYSGVLTGLQRYDIMAGSRTGFLLARAAAIVLLLSLGAGLTGLASAASAVTVLTAVWVVYAAHKVLPGLRIARSSVDFGLLPALLMYSTSTLMFASGQLIVSQASKVLVGFLFTPADVADFAIPFVLVLMVGNFVFALTTATKPMTTLLQAEQEDEKIRRLFLLSTKYGLLVAAPAAASFLLFGDEILRAWVGRSHDGPGGLLLAILAIPQMLRVTQLAGYSVVTGLGKHRYFGLSVLIQAVSGLVLAFILARPLGLGLVGVAIGISIPEVIGNGFFIPRYCCRVVGVRAWDMIRGSVFPAMKATLPVILYLVAARLWIPVDSRASVIAMFGVAVAIWGAATWVLALGRDEMAWIR